MADISPQLIEFLRAHNIEFHRHDHKPIFTCADADVELLALAGAQTKNLFLRDDKGKRHLLLTTTPATVVVWIARLGGFLARKNDGHPGTITLWRGWKRLNDLTDGWLLAREVR